MEGGDWSTRELTARSIACSSTISDVITFHSYDQPDAARGAHPAAEGYNRPIDLHGVHGARQRQHLQAVAADRKKHKVGAINWGLVQGKTQTHLPWDSWQRPYVDREPAGVVPRSLPQRRHAVRRKETL